jgi:phosphoribosylanthranilate isomerase
MRVWVKICGLTTEEAVDAAVVAGADAVGFVFAESPRRVTPERAAELARRLPPSVLKVAVFADPGREEIEPVLERLAPDRIQMEAVSPLLGSDGLRERAIPVFRASVDLAERVDRFLKDRKGGRTASAPTPTGVEGAVARQRGADPLPFSNGTILLDGGSSGRGESADWSLAERIARKSSIILAGGLNATNVGRAIRQVRPHGVDVSSGVESSRGVKDPVRIAAFLDAVRRAEDE